MWNKPSMMGAPMGQRRFWFLIACVLSLASAWGIELQEYLKLRRQYGVTGVCPPGALDIIVGKKVVEVEGTVQGIASCEGQHSILMSLPESRTLVVSAKALENWLTSGQVSIRALIRVERKNAVEAAAYWLIGAVPRGEMVQWEVEERARRVRLASEAKARSSRTNNLNSRYRASSGRLLSLDPASFKNNLEAVYPYYYEWIRRANPRLKPQEAEQITRALLTYSAYYGVDPRFILAIVLVESGFNPTATSRKGAMGLGQLMPGTARGLGVVNPYDPVQNLEGSVRLVRGHLIKYWNQVGSPNSWEHVILTLAAYNAGSGSVRKYGGVPPYKETQAYIKKVIYWYKRLCGVKE